MGKIWKNEGGGAGGGVRRPENYKYVSRTDRTATILQFKTHNAHFRGSLFHSIPGSGETRMTAGLQKECKIQTLAWGKEPADDLINFIQVGCQGLFFKIVFWGGGFFLGTFFLHTSGAKWRPVVENPQRPDEVPARGVRGEAGRLVRPILRKRTEYEAEANKDRSA